MRPRLLVLATTALALGCLRSRTVPSIEMYRLLPTTAETASVTLPVSVDDLPEGSLAVSRYITPGLYGQRGIVYRVGDAGYGAYPSREWAIPLGEMLGRRTADLLQERPLLQGGTLFDPPTRRTFTHLWRGTVREFEEINRGNNVFVAVNLEASLIRVEDDSILWSGAARVERAVPEGTIEGIVAGLSAATDEVVFALLDSAKVSIRQKSANGGAPEP
jgi:uncharacterized lipoprotein YmbA